MKLLYLLLLSLISSCSHQKKNQDLNAWKKNAQAQIEANSLSYKNCGKLLSFGKNKEINLNIVLNIHSTGKLESLDILPSHLSQQSFYDCLFNEFDKIKLPAHHAEKSIQIEQPLSFIKVIL